MVLFLATAPSFCGVVAEDGWSVVPESGDEGHSVEESEAEPTTWVSWVVDPSRLRSLPRDVFVSGFGFGVMSSTCAMAL
jgi:hypothetical protein